MTSAYQQLTKTFQRLSRFSHVTAIAGCDMQTTMPPGGSQARGEALAERLIDHIKQQREAMEAQQSSQNQFEEIRRLAGLVK